MSIVDSIRKKTKVASKRILRNKNDELDSSNKFFGDLSNLDKTINTDVPSHTPPVQPRRNDSSDSVVFLSYIEQTKSGWECVDCGTINSFWTTCCTVCGLAQR